MSDLWEQHLHSAAARNLHLQSIWLAYSVLARGEIAVGHKATLPNDEARLNCALEIRILVISAMVSMFDREGTNLKEICDDAPVSAKNLKTWYDEVIWPRWEPIRLKSIQVRANLGNHAPRRIASHKFALETANLIDTREILTVLNSIQQFMVLASRLGYLDPIDAVSGHALAETPANYPELLKEFLDWEDDLEESMRDDSIWRLSEVFSPSKTWSTVCNWTFHLPARAFSWLIRAYGERRNTAILELFIHEKFDLMPDEVAVSLQHFAITNAIQLTYNAFLHREVDIGPWHTCRSEFICTMVTHELLILWYSHLTTLFESQNLRLVDHVLENPFRYPASCADLCRRYIIPEWESVQGPLREMRNKYGFHRDRDYTIAESTHLRTLNELNPSFAFPLMAALFCLARYIELVYQEKFTICSIPHYLPSDRLDPRFPWSPWHNPARGFKRK